jgi:GPH family glycoside/pentoside/hexuronide:cation symporter
MFNNNLVYYSKYALDFHEYQWAILGTLNGITFLAVPAWAYVALKIGKKNTWLIAMILLLLGFIGFYYFSISGLIQLLFVLAFIGFANGATGVLFWSMLPDTIEFGEWKTGIRTESSLYGFMTFAQKGAIAIAAFILGMVLTGIGFEPNEVQSAQTISDLKTLMTLIPITGICISFILMWFYPIDKKFHSQLIADIQNRGIS